MGNIVNKLNHKYFQEKITSKEERLQKLSIVKYSEFLGRVLGVYKKV